MIDPSVVEACKRTDIVGLIGRSLKLRRRGTDYVTLCPFHDERTPSFTVIPKKNCFYCFGCRVGGSPIDWVMKHEHVSFQEAVRRLAEQGSIDVRQADEHEVLPVRREPPETVLRGRKLGPVVALDQAMWRKFRDEPTGAVDQFAESRKLDASVLESLGVVCVDYAKIGFTYFDPSTGMACTMKVRSVEGKSFYVEPKSRDDAKPLMPLYLGHDLDPTVGSLLKAVIITEGETDALTLRCMGFRNVVSLPQGAQSAKHADLLPLWPFNVWILSTDADQEGDNAAIVLRDRARRIGVDTVRVTWSRNVDGEMVYAKDANELRMGGATPEDFASCVNVLTEQRFRYVVPLAHEAHG